MKREEWKMSDWMEPFRDDFANTGGNPIEDLMNDHDTNSFNNSVRAALIVAVSSQVILLTRLYGKGVLASKSLPKSSPKRRANLICAELLQRRAECRRLRKIMRAMVHEHRVGCCCIAHQELKQPRARSAEAGRRTGRKHAN